MVAQYERLLDILLPVFLWVSIGIGLRFLLLKISESTDQLIRSSITRYVMNIATPMLILATFSSITIKFEDALAMIAAGFLYLIVSLVITIICLFFLLENFRSYWHPLVFGNIGNLGLSISFYTYGDIGLSYAISFFVVMVSAQFFLTPLAFLGAKQKKIKLITSVPVIPATLVGITMLAYGFSLDGPIFEVINIIGSTAIPLSLVSLGIAIVSLKVVANKKLIILSFVRIFVGLSASLVVIAVTSLGTIGNGILLLNGVMPTAIFCYLFALQYNNQPEEVAGIVLITTLIGIVFIPSVVFLLIS
jgi:hypothetical protein